MESNFIKNFKDSFETYLIGLSFILYLFRVTIPFLKFPFLIVYLYLIIYIIFRYKERIFQSLIEFVRNYLLLLFLALSLIISFLFSDKLYLTIFKDIINSIILLSFFLVLTITVRTKRELKLFIVCLINLVILFTLILSIYRLSNLFTIFPDNTISAFQTENNLNVFSLSSDYNFATLYIFLGLFSIISYFIVQVSLVKRLIYNSILIIYSITIFFAGSRRGGILLLIIIFALILVQLHALLKKDHFLGKLASNTRYFFLALLILIASCYMFTVNYSYKVKNKVLEFIGTKNLPATKEGIAFAIWKYYLALNKDQSYFDTFNSIWTPEFIPEDPDWGWGSKIHKTIYPLTGKNVEMVPTKARGYLMDHTTNSDYLNGSACSASWISHHIVDDEKILHASVYCYVSADCDLTTVNICSLGAMGNPGANYNFQYRGSWQKLSFEIGCKTGNASVLLYIAKYGSSNFDSLKGYVIFAYPQVRVFEKNIKPLSNSDKAFVKSNMDERENNIPNGFNFLTLINHIKQPSRKQVLFKNGWYGYGYNLSIPSDIFDIKKTERLKHFDAGFVNLSLNFFPSIVIATKDNDPIRNWASHLISEDTVYYGYKAKLKVDSLTNDFLNSRLVRWQFAIQIFSREFNLKQKLFGGGFNFFNWYGSYFLHDKTQSDYPHNPFLSILLYSGIMGFILYIYLLFKVFYYYLKFLKEYILLFLFFLITFFFSFFSGGSPFDPPIMGFFILLPYFVHFIDKNENTPKNIL